MTSVPPPADSAADIDIDLADADGPPADDPAAPSGEPLLTTDAAAQTDDPLISPEAS